MTRPIIHLCAPASPATSVFGVVGAADARELIARVQAAIGSEFEVTGRPALLAADFDEKRGGRRDDAARVRELHEMFVRDEVVALLAARGGGWLTRILPEIDFSLLDRRRRPLAVFGFSEITPLVNIIGRHARGRGYYYMTPGFPRAGAERYARLNARRLNGGRTLTGRSLAAFAKRWADERFAADFAAYFRDVSRVLRGVAPSRQVRGRLVSGRLPAVSRAALVGGCLTLVTPLTTQRYAQRCDPAGKWLVLEDLDEYAYRIDRQFAHLKLAGWFERCAGVLLGDFHSGDEDQRAETLEILHFHLPRGRNVPVVTTSDVGHTWPQAILPIGKPLTVQSPGGRGGVRRVRFKPDWRRLRVL